MTSRSTSNRAGNDRTIECQGPLTARELSKLDEAIDACLDEGATQVNLDLRHVTYADPIMVDVLAIQGELCRELGVRVGLSFGEAVRKTLNSVGFDELVACGIELHQTIRLTAPFGDNGNPIPQWSTHAMTMFDFVGSSNKRRGGMTILTRRMHGWMTPSRSARTRGSPLLRRDPHKASDQQLRGSPDFRSDSLADLRIPKVVRKDCEGSERISPKSL